MEERASIRPELPLPKPSLSYWQEPPSALANHQTTAELPLTVDVVIIGSGITGASLAYNILNQAAATSVLMLEARTACSGATGRNGGHTKHAAYREFFENVKSHGEEQAAKIVTFKTECMRAVHTFAKAHNIDCDSWQGDTVDAFYDQGQLEKAKKAVGEIKRVLGENDPSARYQFWHAEETKRNFLVEGSYGAVSYEAGSLWPYRFVIGLLDLAIKQGLNLQTQTPALAITRREAGQKRWTVRTPRGEVNAEKVLLAKNGYTARLCPTLQGVIVPLRGHMTAQRPGLGLPQSGLNTTYSFIYDHGYEYMISRVEGSKFAGDIMIGGGSTIGPDNGLREFGTTDDTTTDPVIVEYLRDSAQTRFGSNWGEDNAKGRLRYAWSGIMGYSADGFPLVGQMPGEENLYICSSFQGLGMVLCFNSAKALISIMNREDESRLDQWFPAAFRLIPDRFNHKFRGRLHTKVAPMDLELRSQN